MNAAPASAPALRFTVQSPQLVVRQALAELLGELAPLQLESEEAGTVELVMAEALNNIIEHAYAATKGSGPIAIHCAHHPNGLHLLIEDQGAPMPGDATPLGLAQPLGTDIQDLPEGGFGWFLIHQLAKDVHYTRAPGGNQLRLRLAISIGPHS
ncbi:MAG: ATP-binding protein [Sulfitobacter sp.]